MPKLPVLTKASFVRRYRAGEFGNASPTWNTLREYLASGYRGLVHIRNRTVGGPTWYNVPWNGVEHQWELITSRSNGKPPEAEPSGLYLSAMAPHRYNLMQGEVCQSENHLDLTYSTVSDLPMREALSAQTKHAWGIVAIELLRWAFDPSSYDWMGYLLENYPGHILEFSAFSRPWGTVPNRNVVWWEVRAY